MADLGIEVAAGRHNGRNNEREPRRRSPLSHVPKHLECGSIGVAGSPMQKSADSRELTTMPEAFNFTWELFDKVSGWTDV